MLRPDKSTTKTPILFDASAKFNCMSLNDIVLHGPAKRAIYAILNPADITDEELLSAVVGAEGLLNSRTITYQQVDPADLTSLTPNHFLHGQLGGRFAPKAIDEVAFNPRKR